MALLCSLFSTTDLLVDIAVAQHKLVKMQQQPGEAGNNPLILQEAGTEQQQILQKHTTQQMF